MCLYTRLLFLLTMRHHICFEGTGRGQILYWTSQNTFKFTMSATWQKHVEHIWEVDPASSFTPKAKADITDWTLQEGSFGCVNFTIFKNLQFQAHKCIILQRLGLVSQRVFSSNNLNPFKTDIYIYNKVITLKIGS